MSELKVGIVGMGWVAGAHIETYKAIQGVRVVGVHSLQPLDAAELERRFGIPLKIFADYASMLRDPDLDIINICTPHHLHAQMAIAAAEAGKHVMIEKPVALSFEDAKAIRVALRKSGVKACVGFEARFSAHFNLVRSVIDQGLLGDLHYGEVDYYHGIGPWYGQYEWNVKKGCGGSSLLTAGCHSVDGLIYFMGEPVEEVMSYKTKSKSRHFSPYEYDTSITSIFKFRGGKVGKVASVVDCLQPYYFHIHLVGSEGSLLDNKFYSERLKGLDKSKWSVLETALIDSGDVKDHPYEPQFQAFVDAIRTNGKMPLTDFETAFESHRAVFAADLSAELGRPVKIEELA